MNLRFYNARTCTMDGSPAITQGELWAVDGMITHVGSPQGEANPPIFDREIDLGGNLILPGFKNAHAHSPMTFLRSYADDLPLGRWLEEKIFPMEARLTEEDAVLFAKIAMLEYLSSGITAAFDMYIYPHAVAEAAIACGFRSVLCGPLNDFTSSLEELERDFRHYRSWNPLVSMRLGFHAEYTTSRELLEGVAALAEKYRAPVWTHLAETRDEAEGCVERHGTTPAVFLDSLGIWNHGGGGYHCVHMSEADLEVFRRRGLTAVTNPGSNVKLASGIAPLEEMRRMGIPLAIGTDGPASNNCLDFFREMFLAAGLQKLAAGDASAMPWEAVLTAATMGGASAMGLEDCDRLTPGKKADLVVIDLDRPNMRPLHNPLANLIYSGSKENVLMTVVDGKILYERGEFHVGFDPLELYSGAEKALKRIVEG